MIKMMLEMMGQDIRLNNNYDITLDSNNSFSRIKALENLSQAIINRFLTPKGFFKFYPKYGSYLYRILSKGNTENTLIYAKQVIYEALLQEPRIQNIDDIEVNYGLNRESRAVLNIKTTLTPINEVEKFNFVWDFFIN
jgi:phage baseplate assembly protein W